MQARTKKYAPKSLRAALARQKLVQCAIEDIHRQLADPARRRNSSYREWWVKATMQMDAFKLENSWLVEFIAAWVPLDEGLLFRQLYLIVKQAQRDAVEFDQNEATVIEKCDGYWALNGRAT